MYALRLIPSGTVILEELVLHNLREIVSFARVHEDRFVQMVMDTDMKQRNKDLAKRKAPVRR